MIRETTTGPATRRPAPTRRTPTALALSVLAALALGGCQDQPDTDPSADGPAADPAVRADEGAGSAGITVVDPWVRVAIRPEGSDAPGAPPVNSAAYLTLRNPGPADALVVVETEVADTAELHSVSMDEGVMRMRPVDSVAVAAGGEAVLEPGGYHVMLIGIRRALEEGDSVPLTLRLRGGDSVRVTAPVRKAPPM